jgi:hypothetical protein
MKMKSPCKNDRTRKFVLCLDGVSWEVVHELKARGYFKMFHEPSRVIAPFPAMTNVSLSTIWQKSAPAGYEGLYFDRAANTLSGGWKGYVRRRVEKPGSFDELMHYTEPKPYEFLIYVFPDWIVQADLKRCLKAYYSHDGEVLRAYIRSSDGLTHVGGRKKLEPFLIHVDAALSKIYQEREGKTELALFSDHGNNFVRSQRVPLDAYLKQCGFEVADTIKNARSVVIPAFGLVNYAAVYTQEENRPRVANLLAKLAAVDLCLYRSGATAYLIGRHGEATIEFDSEGDAYLYRASSGDPLELNPLLDSLAKASKVTRAGYVRDADWFDATKDHKYPDAVYRAYRGIHSQVQNNADVLISLKDGYFYGNQLFDKLVTIEATHGSLRDTSSLAFYMSTHVSAPSHLRGGWLRAYLP